MASGKKNYFRHSTSAFEDPKIQGLVNLYGLKGYAYYFILLELCARQCENEFKEEIVVHTRTVLSQLRKTPSGLSELLSAMTRLGLLQYSMEENFLKIKVPKLAKYMGKYESKLTSNSPNKRKEKEIKEKESKVKGITPDEIIDLWNFKHGAKFGRCPGVGGGKHRDNILEAIKFLPTLESWDELFTKATSSDFLTGNNGSDWTVNFLWLIDYDNALKVLSDNYDDQKIVRAIQAEFLQKVSK